MSLKNAKNANKRLSTVERGLLDATPNAYFKKKTEKKEPIAPVRMIITGFLFEIAATLVAFSVMFWFFYSQPNQKVTTSDRPLAGQSCTVLSPKIGTTYFSQEHSENGQFASPAMTTEECVASLKSKKVCDVAVRFDHLALWGVAEPNITQYYPGGSGYLSFSPTETSGVSTTFSILYGQSVSFSKPDITPTVTRSSTFRGSSNNLYIFNFAKDAPKDAFVAYPGVDVPSLAFDAKKNILADLTSSFTTTGSKRKRDYDLSTTTIDDSWSNSVGDWKAERKTYNYIDIGISNDVYHSLRAGPKFYGPAGLAVDLFSGWSSNSPGSIFVADQGHGLIRKLSIDTSGYGITDVTDISADSGSTPFSLPCRLALDNSGNLFVSDIGTNKLYKVPKGATAATELALTGYTFSNLFGLAFWQDSSGQTAIDYLFVIDTNFQSFITKIVKVKLSDGSCSVLFTAACPADSISVGASGKIYYTSCGLLHVSDSAGTTIKTLGGGLLSGPMGLAVHTSELYAVVASNGNNLVRKINLSTGDVTSIGTNTDAPLRAPIGVAFDSMFPSLVFVSDSDYHITMIYSDSPLSKVTRLRFFKAPKVLSTSILPPAQQYQVSPTVTAKFRGQLGPSTEWTSVTWSPPYVFDTAKGGCINSQMQCLVIVQSKFNQENGKIYTACNSYSQGVVAAHLIFLYILDPTARTVAPSSGCYSLQMQKAPLRFIMETIQTANGVVLYTSAGAYGSTGATISNTFTDLVTTTGTTVLDISKIPALPGKAPQFLLVLVEIDGLTYTATYDSVADSYNRDLVAAARTHVMLAYTWGVCDDKATKGLVEISFNNAYSNQCQLPSKGMYYQSKNQYYAIPYSCLSIAYDKLLTDCAEIKANMKALVDDTCDASITKMCTTQYTSNPPFLCTANSPPPVLSVISLSASNSMAISSFLAIVVAALLSRAHKNYKATPDELDDVNPPIDADSSSDAVASNKDEQGDVEMTAGNKHNNNNNNNDDDDGNGSEVRHAATATDGPVTQSELVAALRREKQQHAEALEKIRLESQQHAKALEKQVEGVMALLKASASAPATQQQRTNGSARVGVEP